MKPALKQLLTSTLPVLAALAVGCGVGFWMADAPDQPAAPVAEDAEPHAGHAHGAPPPAAEASDATTYTCSMHPSVRSDTPGQCPLCGMDLVPTSTNAGQAGRVMMSEEARILAAIETVEVVQGPAIRTVRLVGQVAPADTGIDAVTAWFRGRIERLYVDFVGAEVTKGDKLYSIFSPELLTAQRELLATAARKTKVASLPGSVLTEAAEHAHTAARERLRLWGMSNWQIAQVLKRKQAKERFVRYAAHSGTVTAVDVREGNWVKEGSAILTLTDLSRVWVEFQAYEQDLAWIALGQTVDFTTPSQPGRRLTGDVAFISPTIDPRTRTATIRIIVPDADAEKTLRPGSFVVGDARILLEDPEPLTIPLTAPLISGERAIVFVEMAGEDMPTYLPREVQLGRRTDHGWVVEAGLMAGERVVKAGAFKLDSDLQIRGEPSLMTPPKPSAESTKASGTTTSAPEEPILGKQGRTALSNVVRAAMVLSEAMAADDARAAEMAAPKLNDALMSLASEVDGQALSTALSDAATALTAAANSLDAIRSAYVALNQTLWPLVLRHKGLLRGAYQITFCPMANNDQGAYWLQGPGDVRNPYYGAEMLSCGAATHLVGGSTP